jgi:ribosomal protein S27E
MTETVQCSRCLAYQTADVSESIAITCKFCGETDAAYID